MIATTLIRTAGRGLGDWLHRARRSAHRDLDCPSARGLLVAYSEAVVEGADRHELSAILTGIAGCLLAQSACWWLDGDPGKAERDRLSGLLIQEVSYCAGDDRPTPSGYGGVRSCELPATETVTRAFEWLALAYRGRGEPADPDGGELVVWGCLSVLVDVIADAIPGTWPGPEILAEMSDAHFGAES